MTNFDTFTAAFGQLRVKRDEPMRLHTGNKVGGPADMYVEALTVEELVRAYTTARELHFPVTILGGATNVLVSDRGVRGLVIKNRTSQIKLLGVKGTITGGDKKVSDVLLEADSGVQIGHLVRYTIEESLGGLESFLGLPGTVGGATYNNSHFQRHGEYIGDHIVAARLLTPGGVVKEVEVSYFEFGYDYSKLQETGEIVLVAQFRLKPADKASLWAKANEASKTIRLAEQPYQVPSCGCTWQNITREDALRIGTPNLTLSAGYLIDQLGLKGTRSGNAQISDKHANFIVNLGGATAADWLLLMKHARIKVRERFDVTLKPEIFLIGDFTEEERGEVLD